MSMVIQQLGTFNLDQVINLVKKRITLVSNQIYDRCQFQSNLILKCKQFIVYGSLLFRSSPEIEFLRIEIRKLEEYLIKLIDAYKYLLQEKYTQNQIIIEKVN